MSDTTKREMRKGLEAPKTGDEKGMGVQAYNRSRRRNNEKRLHKKKKKVRGCAWSLLLVMANNAEMTL